MIAVTETWLAADTQDLYTISDFKFVSHPRVNKVGGGVGLSIKKDFEFKIRHDLCCLTDYIECNITKVP